MNQQLIGVAVPSEKVQDALAMIERAEQLGIPAAWMTTGMARPDNLTTFAAAAVRTQRIKLGTSIVPTFHFTQILLMQPLHLGEAGYTYGLEEQLLEETVIAPDGKKTATVLRSYYVISELQ